MEELRNTELNTYPLFSLNGYTTYAKILRNYDGDTVNIIFMYKEIPMHIKARLYGYDTSEMKPLLDDPNREEKKNKALEAKKRLWYLCTKQEEEKSHKTLIKIKCGNYDKYGRLLITVFNEDYEIDPLKTNNELFKDSINNQMITEGHGYPYYGGTKQDF